ncbi:MAG: DUF445 domain-containing protein [Peptococcaceae bacterium]|nr:DUF445 domain-containing protein [Peptococcaceae bacterium]
MNYRQRANMILTIVFIAFMATAMLRHLYGKDFALQLVFFVLEAALVGGIADWFAVTAIFKKPLGFAYHTALIPRNRVKIEAAVANMVQTDLLSLSSLQSKIRNARYSQILIAWLENEPDIKQALINSLAAYVQQWASQLDVAHLAGRLETMLRNKLGQLDLSEQLQRIGLWALERHKDEQILVYLLNELETLAARPDTQAKILEFLEEQKREKTQSSTLKSFFTGILESTDSLNLDDAAAAISRELMHTLSSLHSPQHPLRRKLREILAESMAQMALRPDWQQGIAAWQTDVLERLPLAAGLDSMLTLLFEAATGTAGEQQESMLVNWVKDQGTAYWEYFRRDVRLQNWLDHYLAGIILQVVTTEHYLIGDMVRETLTGFSNDDLSRFIDDKAGNDLQWIRINGSLVGGLLGLIIFLAMQLVFDPILLPMLHTLLH